MTVINLMKLRGIKTKDIVVRTKWSMRWNAEKGIYEEVKE